MNKDKLINEIVELEKEWITEIKSLFEYGGDADKLIDCHVHTVDEWNEAIAVYGIEFPIQYRDTLKKLLKSIKEDSECRERLLEDCKEAGLNDLDNIPKQPLV